MSEPQWEYKRVYLKGNTDSSEHIDPAATFYYFGKANPEAPEWQDDLLDELGRDGWELVSAVPLIGGRVKQAPSICWGVTYTIGVMLWFKRLLASS